MLKFINKSYKVQIYSMKCTFYYDLIKNFLKIISSQLKNIIIKDKVLKKLNYFSITSNKIDKLNN